MPSLFSSNRFRVDADARLGCLTTTLILEGPHLEPSIMLMDLESGTCSGLSTQCLTNPPPGRGHNRPSFVKDSDDSLTGL